MTEYRVRWEIDIEAPTPLEAARIVWTEYMRRTLPARPDDGCVLEIERKDPDGSAEAECIDLFERPEDWIMPPAAAAALPASPRWSPPARPR